MYFTTLRILIARKPRWPTNLINRPEGLPQFADFEENCRGRDTAVVSFTAKVQATLQFRFRQAISSLKKKKEKPELGT
jgi:hypothetical protein